MHHSSLAPSILQATQTLLSQLSGTYGVGLPLQEFFRGVPLTPHAPLQDKLTPNRTKTSEALLEVDSWINALRTCTQYKKHAIAPTVRRTFHSLRR